MAKWLGGFDGGLAHGIPAAKIEKFKDWLWDQPTYKGLQLIALHNAGAPNMTQTDKTPGGYDQRQRNIAPHYKAKAWRGGPAFNIYPDGTIRGGTPWGVYGVHCNGWNDTGIGIEMMADFRTGVDDDDAGRGLEMKNTACEMIAAILKQHGLPVSNTTVKLHREGKTTHACPGNDILKSDIMARVQAYYDAMEEGGDHLPELDVDAPQEPLTFSFYNCSVDDLNVRSSGSMASKILTTIDKGQLLKVWSTTSNGSTAWAHVTGSKDNYKTYFDGHVAFAYLKPAPAPESPAPATEPSIPIPTPPVVVIPTPTDRPYWAARILMIEERWPAHWAAGGIGAAMTESYKDLRVHAAGDDPDGKGPLGPTAFTIWQLRNERHDNFKKFAASRGKSEDDFETQVLWPTRELPISEKLAWKWLQQATTVEQAAAAFAFYERPRGYVSADAKAATTWDDALKVARKVSHWDWRLSYAEALYKKIS